LVPDRAIDELLEKLLVIATELTGARHAAIGDPPRRAGVLAAPIVIRGEAWGHLHLTDKRDAAEFTAARSCARSAPRRTSTACWS
jgi:GAF domain-containing protein